MTVANLTPPVISGTWIQGRTAVTTDGTWTFTEDYITYAYQWYRCNAAGASCVPIAGATSASYVLAFADVGNTVRSEVTATEHTSPPDPGGDLLTWSPPTAGAGGVEIVTFDLNNSSRTSSLLGQGAGRDLVINQTQIITGPVAQMVGWRNVIWIGGEMNISSATGVVTGVAIRNITGIFHMEGVYMHGSAGPHDVFVIRSPDTSQGCIVQIENCRLEAKEHASEHADCIQFQQAKVNGLRLDKVTLVSELQSTFMRVGGSAVDYAKNIEFKRLNYKGTGDNCFWQNWETGDSTTSLKQIVPVTLTDVWIDMTGSARPNVARRVVPDQTGYSGGQSNSRRAAYMDSDVDGDFCYFSDGTQLAPNGQMSLTCQIDGIIRDGIPPDGDWCPTSVPGIAYVSPGYL